MPRFAANLSMMFTEWEFLDRFRAAAEAGFEAVEFLFPYEHTPEQIGLALAGSGLTQALYNLPPGDFGKGERGIASLAGREDELRASVDTALSYVHETGVRRLHMMAGLADPNDPVAQKTYRASLAYAADNSASRGSTSCWSRSTARTCPAISSMISIGRRLISANAPGRMSVCNSICIIAS